MTPTIAIIGSLEKARVYDPPIWDPDMGFQACEELGEQLAAAGFGLTVYSSNPRFIEGAVVRGYAGSNSPRPGSIELLVPLNSSHKQFPEMKDHPDMVRVVNDPDDWEVSFYRSMAAVDGVVLVGGGGPTYVAGLVALAIRTPIVALGCFGGAAQSVWESLSRTNQATAEELHAMADGWSDASAANMVQILQSQARRREEDNRATQRESRRATLSLVVAAILFIFGLAVIPLLFAVEPRASVNIGALLLASLLVAPIGAVIRNYLGGGRDWFQTAVLGVVAGAVASLLFIVAQVATSPEALKDEGASDAPAVCRAHQLRRRSDLRRGLQQADGPRRHGCQRLSRSPELVGITPKATASARARPSRSLLTSATHRGGAHRAPPRRCLSQQ